MNLYAIKTAIRWLVAELRIVRWTLMLCIACSVSILVRTSYLTGKFIGVTQVHTEASAAGAGYYDIFGDGKWHWGKR